MVKSLVDACVTAALLTLTITPGSNAAYFMDLAGSAAIAIYLIINGVITIKKK